MVSRHSLHHWHYLGTDSYECRLEYCANPWLAVRILLSCKFRRNYHDICNPVQGTAVVIVSLLLQVSTLEDGCDTALGLISSTYDDHTTPFGSIQEALDDVALKNHSNLETPTICLPPGTHHMTRPLWFGPLSLRLIGSRNSTIVECEYDAQNLESGIDYTWQFNQSKQLYLSGIQFLNCPYPFRVIAVETVTVKQCTFR